jgi:hypothetical protein
MNFARSSRLFVLLGILALYFGRSSAPRFGDSPNVVRFAGIFAVGLGVLVGILSLFGVGRPADERYKAPWISLSLGCMLLLFVGLGELSAVLRGTAQGSVPGEGSLATAPFIDAINGFRLDHPGPDWTIFSKEELRQLNDTAQAVAMKAPSMGGFVFVETADPGFQVAGREQEVGELMIDQFELDEKRVVFNRPDELDGQKAVRCQVVGTKDGRGIRLEGVALIANGRLYRLMTFGPSDQTSEDGLAFRPFMAAFHLLPSEPQAPPAVPLAPAAQK